jgi:hypothetical protein
MRSSRKSNQSPLIGGETADERKWVLFYRRTLSHVSQFRQAEL